MDRKATSENIIIVGGGPSIKGLPLDEISQHGLTIGVNESSVMMPCHIAVSMDRLWMEARYEQLIDLGVTSYFRRCAWKLGYVWEHLRLFNGDIECNAMSDDIDTLTGRNSGQCAMNLAYLMSPKNIFLFGFDMCTDKEGNHYFYDIKKLNDRKREVTDKKIQDKTSAGKYKSEPWMRKFHFMADEFKKKNINVYNVSEISTINCYPKINYEEFVCLAR